MLTILFPTDFSETAENAYVYALHLCEYLQAKLLVLHTHGITVVSGVVPTHVIDEAQNTSVYSLDYYNSRVPRMKEIAQENGLQDVSQVFLLEEGMLLQTIQNCIEKEQVDLLLMGTTGNSGFENKIFGSNTMAAINNVTIPVLSVPHLARFTKLENLCFTNVYEETDEKILNQLVPIAEKYNIEIKSLYVETSGGHVSQDVKQLWKEKFADQKVSFYTVQSEQVAEAISDFVEQASIDLIGNVYHSRTFFERIFQTSLTEKLSYQSNIPLLVFHP